MSQGVHFEAEDMEQGNILGQTRHEWLRDHPDVRASADWESLLATQRAHLSFRDFVYRAPSVPGTGERWFRLSGAPLFDAAGVFTGYRGVGAEVTELYLAKAHAEQASHAKSMFLANMSHEIRTPLNGVLGMAEVLEPLLTNPDQRRMIGTIRRSGESLLTILNNILDMSKIEAGKLVLESVPFSMSDLAERIEDLHALLAEEKGLMFEVLLGSGADAPRLGDPFRVQQILHNLISNAIKFTERGDVAVKISGRGRQPLVIEVRDTGIGMTSGQLAQLHDEFTQADSSISRRFGGTGLGMAITRSLINAMNGTISVESIPESGTTIRVQLPLLGGEAPRAAPPSVSLNPVALRGVRVLAADDNQTNRTVLEMMLKLSGATVKTLTNGAEAVEAWAPGLFDVVLLDIAMPVMDGLTALQHIRTLEAEHGVARVPIIAVTANAMPHQVEEYLTLGFDACVAKPLTSTELSTAICALMAPA